MKLHSPSSSGKNFSPTTIKAREHVGRCVRWQPGERRISISDGSKIHIRALHIENSACLGPRAQTGALLVKGRPQAESAKRRVDATRC
jgi:hypothetical protein